MARLIFLGVAVVAITATADIRKCNAENEPTCKEDSRSGAAMIQLTGAPVEDKHVESLAPMKGRIITAIAEVADLKRRANALDAATGVTGGNHSGGASAAAAQPTVTAAPAAPRSLSNQAASSESEPGTLVTDKVKGTDAKTSAEKTAKKPETSVASGTENTFDMDKYLELMHQKTEMTFSDVLTEIATLEDNIAKLTSQILNLHRQVIGSLLTETAEHKAFVDLTASLKEDSLVKEKATEETLKARLLKIEKNIRDLRAETEMIEQVVAADL